MGCPAVPTAAEEGVHITPAPGVLDAETEAEKAPVSGDEDSGQGPEGGTCSGLLCWALYGLYCSILSGLSLTMRFRNSERFILKMKLVS